MKIFIGKKHCCDLNYTYRIIKDSLYDLGEIVDDVSEADVIVFPATCSGSLRVIKIVMADILDVLKHKKEGAISFVTGCMTSNIKDLKLRNMINKFLNDNFDYIIPESRMADIINIIAKKNVMEGSFGACIDAGRKAELYISKGCVNKCSFCKVNYLDMPLRSVDFEDIKNTINSLPDEIDTVCILGMNTAQYGLDFGYRYNLIDIVKLLDEKETINRILIDGMAFKDAIKNKFAESLKIEKIKIIGGSIETGSPRILSMMDKGYKIPDLLEFFEEINEVYPKEFSTDIIVGFPTENYEDIELTLHLLDILKPNSITLRKYQDCPYIPSSKYPQLTENEINEHFDIYKKELVLRGCLLENK